MAAAKQGLKSGKAGDEDEIRPENVEGIERRRSTLVVSSVLGGVKTWKNTKRLADRCDHSYIQERRS